MAHEVMHHKWTQPDAQTAARWISDQDRMDRSLATFGRRLLDLAALTSGESVLDIGCGTGATTLAAWERVAPSGTVTGVDISPGMLEAARARARELSQTQTQTPTQARITWLLADAEAYLFTPQAAKAPAGSELGAPEASRPCAGGSSSATAPAASNGGPPR